MFSYVGERKAGRGNWSDVAEEYVRNRLQSDESFDPKGVRLFVIGPYRDRDISAPEVIVAGYLFEVETQTQHRVVRI